MSCCYVSQFMFYKMKFEILPNWTFDYIWLSTINLAFNFPNEYKYKMLLFLILLWCNLKLELTFTVKKILLTGKLEAIR